VTCLRALGLGSAIALLPLAACGPTYVASDTERGDGSGNDERYGSGGGSQVAPAGGAPASGGAPSTGGSESTGGGPSSGGSESTDCNVNADCMLAADWYDECFSPDCSHPIAVTQVKEATDPCLAAWGERRDEDVPEECAASERGEDCPAICALPLQCPTSACDDGVCVVKSEPLAACED
jgi:hypothetical protein